MIDVIVILYCSSIILTILFLLLIKRYGFIGAIMNPASYFSVIWIFSGVVMILLDSSDILMPEYFSSRSLSILYSMVFFSGLFFLFWECFFGLKKGHIRFKESKVYFSNSTFFVFVTIVFLASALGFFIFYLDGQISGSIAENRMVYLSGGGYTRFNSLWMKPISYMLFFKPFVYIFGGSISLFYFSSEKKRKLWKLLFILFVIAIINVISDGGRNGLLNFIGLYSFGFSLGYATSEVPKIKLNFKNWLGLIVLGILFLMFIQWNFDERKKLDGVNDSLFNRNDLKFPSFLEGTAEYMLAHNVGFVLRYEDTYDSLNLKQGKSTFNSFLSLKLPFTELLGFGSLNAEDPLDYFNLEREGKPLYYTTHSIFAHLIIDFGYYGSIFVLFLITGLTQFLFHSVLYKPFNKQRFLTLYFLILFFNFWFASNFYTYFKIPLLSNFLAFYIFYIFVFKTRY